MIDWFVYLFEFSPRAATPFNFFQCQNNCIFFRMWRIFSRCWCDQIQKCIQNVKSSYCRNVSFGVFFRFHVAAVLQRRRTSSWRTLLQQQNMMIIIIIFPKKSMPTAIAIKTTRKSTKTMKTMSSVKQEVVFRIAMTKM